MDSLKNAKLAFCKDIASLLIELDTETAEAFIPWLRGVLKDRDACHFEFWGEEADAIYCME